VPPGWPGRPRSCCTTAAHRSAPSTCRSRPRRGSQGPEWLLPPGGHHRRGGTESALADAVAALDGLHIAVNTAGGGAARRTLSKDGPHPLDVFRRTIELNLIGTFNLNRLQALHMSANEPEDGERGVIINTASIAAFEGQIGQVAYTAAKAGIAGMTLPMARDLGSLGSLVLSIAPSLFSTGITAGIPIALCNGDHCDDRDRRRHACSAGRRPEAQAGSQGRRPDRRGRDRAWLAGGHHPRL
jgi:NAD(P)-dependent dehydrogenase (short-subunit alcohol dehydrogenase family)